MSDVVPVSLKTNFSGATKRAIDTDTLVLELQVAETGMLINPNTLTLLTVQRGNNS